jgi:hypothetical protein
LIPSRLPPKPNPGAAESRARPGTKLEINETR